MRTALEAGCPTRYTAVLPALGTGFDEGALLREENLADHGFGSPTPAPSGEPSAPGIEVRSVPIPPFATPDEVEGMLLCRYVPEHLLPTPEVAGTFAYLEGSGLFVDSRTLGREDALTVLAAADFAAAPAVPCTQEATEFVALFPLPDSGINGPPITVEVDGCQRISGFGSGFTPASAELLALVG
jgi:hypothetical protein